MAKLPTLAPADAPPDVQRLYLDFQRKMGFPAAPNFIKAQGHSLAVVRATLNVVEQVLVAGSLPRTLKEMMFVAISRDRNCRYCEAAHLACCRMLGVDAATMDQVVTNIESVNPRRTRDLLKFGVKCARAPQTIGDADFEALRAHGLNHGEIVEAIAMSALAVYANTIADAAGIDPDEMFSTI